MGTSFGGVENDQGVGEENDFLHATTDAAGSGAKAARAMSRIRPMNVNSSLPSRLELGGLNIGVECQRCNSAVRWNAMFCPTCGFASPYTATMKKYPGKEV